ncbi:MAG: hypothetical protein WBV80_14760 [Mycobacterium sp.]
MTTRSAPRYWLWSHDIQPDQVADLSPDQVRPTMGPRVVLPTPARARAERPVRRSRGGIAVSTR